MTRQKAAIRKAKAVTVPATSKVIYAATAGLTALLIAFAASAEPVTSRFIPVELWTGGPWNAAPGLRMPEVDVTFGKRNHKRIHGPIDWARPGSGEKLKVYERTNRSKTQLFALRNDGQGLGRVYDSRRNRYCKGAIKFPLGIWKQGGTRTFTFSCGRKTREVVLTILEIDFNQDGVPHSLKYRWVADGGTKRGTNNIYTYSPGRGMVAVEQE